MDASSPAPPGFFGKIPARGDFLSRRLPAELATRWEEWLGTLTTAAKEAAGPDWPDAWLTAPLWHFALGAALAPPHGAAGVLVASADRVGRLFPFTVVGGCDPGRKADPAALLRWGQAVEELVLDALEDGFDPATLDASLAQLGPPPPVTGPNRAPGAQALAEEDAPPPDAGHAEAQTHDDTHDTDDDAHDAVAAILDDPSPAPPQEVSADVASILGDDEPEAEPGPRRGQDEADNVTPRAGGAIPGDDRPGAGQSVWWCRGSDRVAPTRLRCTGLPDPATGAAMMLGSAAVTPG